MTHTATAQVPTAHASKYLQQLCKHWQHNLAVAFTADHGTVTFPRDARGADWAGDGLVTFDAGEAALSVRIDASAEGQLEALEGRGRASSRPLRLSRSAAACRLAIGKVEQGARSIPPARPVSRWSASCQSARAGRPLTS